MHPANLIKAQGFSPFCRERSAHWFGPLVQQGDNFLPDASDFIKDGEKQDFLTLDGGHSAQDLHDCKPI